ncbi:hypothetical protein [Clostridium manihotivorum]|nr:hypothetical protein [Clostridium manihotivorum]
MLNIIEAAATMYNIRIAKKNALSMVFPLYIKATLKVGNREAIPIV